ncbi:hypothetical protein N9B72_00095 [Bacteriovoracaceae bacterium]|nr:hypothetical protein [Bacteriovoracaceae bacterium]
MLLIYLCGTKPLRIMDDLKVKNTSFSLFSFVDNYVARTVAATIEEKNKNMLKTMQEQCLKTPALAKICGKIKGQSVRSFKID